jgi:hypothetical protein
MVSVADISVVWCSRDAIPVRRRIAVNSYSYISLNGTTIIKTLGRLTCELKPGVLFSLIASL